MTVRRTHPEPVSVADLAAAAGLAMAAGDERACASLRVTLAELVDADDLTPKAEHAGIAALAEVLVAFEDARRVRAELDRQARARRPLRDNVLVELVHRGPSTPAELIAALHDTDNRICDVLRQLNRDGLIQPTATNHGRARRYELSRAGIAAAMAG